MHSSIQTAFKLIRGERVPYLTEVFIPTEKHLYWKCKVHLIFSVEVPHPAVLTFLSQWKMKKSNQKQHWSEFPSPF